MSFYPILSLTRKAMLLMPHSFSLRRMFMLRRIHDGECSDCSSCSRVRVFIPEIFLLAFCLHYDVLPSCLKRRPWLRKTHVLVTNGPFVVLFRCHVALWLQPRARRGTTVTLWWRLLKPQNTMFSSVLILAAGAAAQTLTGPFDCTPAGAYTLCQNLWGRSAGTGSQSSTLISTNGNTVSWSTTWNWQNGPSSVKSCTLCVVRAAAIGG